MPRQNLKNFISGLYRGAGIGTGFALAFLSTALLAVTISGTLKTDFAGGDPVSAAQINTNFITLQNAILGLPDCTEASAAYQHSGAQTLSNLTSAQLTNTTAMFDNGSLTTTPGQFTITTAGRYYVTAFVYFDTNATGNRFAQILHNGSQVSAQEVPALTTGATQLSMSGIANMAAGDNLTLTAQQGSGGNLDVSQLRFSVFRICGN